MDTLARAKPITLSQRKAAEASRERMMMRARRLNRLWRYRLQAAALLPLALALRQLPVDTAARLGGWIGRHLLSRIDNVARSRATLRVAFPELSDADAETLLRGMYENVGAVLGETMHLGAFAGTDNPRLRLIGVHNVRAAQALDSGVLFISGHFGNWELFEVALASLGLSGAKVLQHPSNPYVLERLAFDRYAWGLDEQIAQGEGVFVRSRAALRAGRAVQMLCDQRTHKGIKVPFFGVATTTNAVPARLARETGAPIVLMEMRRLGPAQFEITFQPPRRYESDDDEAQILLALNTFFEEQIRRDPAHWLWGHARWDDAVRNIPAEPLITPPLDSQ